MSRINHSRYSRHSRHSRHSRSSGGAGLLSWLSLLSLLVFPACEEDVYIFAPPRFIPVVYCLLDPQDSVQAVRVSRVFQDRKQLSEWDDRYDVYLADSSNRIYIEHIGPDSSRNIYNFTHQKKLHTCEDTLFACTDIYIASFKPYYHADYQLYVYFPETKTMASAKIRTLSRISLVDPAIVPGRKLAIDPSQPYVVRWYSSPGTAYYQGIFHINYLEEEPEQIVGRTVNLTLRPVLEYSDRTVIDQNVSGMHLLQVLGDQIPVRDGVRRKLTGFDFTFYYGGAEMALFANSGMNPKGNEGMVLDYSNIDNARGLFSSISSLKVNGITLTDQTIDTIALHPLTRKLNFLLSHEDF